MLQIDRSNDFSGPHSEGSPLKNNASGGLYDDGLLSLSDLIFRSRHSGNYFCDVPSMEELEVALRSLREFLTD